jgi:hypothetical protein
MVIQLRDRFFFTSATRRIPQLDERMDALLPLVVVEADHDHVLDRAMLAQSGFYLGWENVHTDADDHVDSAISYEDVALLVDPSEIP